MPRRPTVRRPERCARLRTGVAGILADVRQRGDAAVLEATARFEEAYGVIVRAWTSEARFSHRGRFWQYEDILVEPPPAQRPHPPLWIAAGTPESIARVVRLGANLLLDQFASAALVGVAASSGCDHASFTAVCR